MADESRPTPFYDGQFDYAPLNLTGAAGGLSGVSYVEVVEAATPSVEERLLAHCRAFISKQGISCSETVYQCDWVIENAYEFIDGICEIVGYQPDDDDA